MGITVGPRPYGQNALAFIVGGGTANKERKLMNRQQRAQQMQSIGPAIGQAVGAIGSAPYQAQIFKSQNAIQAGTRNWLAAQDDARALANRTALVNREAELQKAYSAQRHEQAMDEFAFEKTGTTPESLMRDAVRDSYSPSAPAPQTYMPQENFTPAEPLNYTPAGPADGGSMAGAPPPARLADQQNGFTYEYTPQARMLMSQYDEAMQALEMSNKYTPEEKIRAYAVLADKKSRIRKVAVPQNPVPMIPGPDGVWQPMQLGFNEAPSRPGIIFDGQDFKPYTPPSKGAPVNYADMDPTQQMAYRVGAVGGWEEYQAVKARGGTVLVNPSDGKVSIDYPKAAASEKPPITYDKARTQAFKELSPGAMEFTAKKPTAEMIDKRAQEIMRAANAATGTREVGNAQVEADKATLKAILAKGFRTDEDNRILAEIEARSGGR